MGGILIGFIPFLIGIYLAIVKEDYSLAIVCFLISFIAFRQVTDEKPKKKKRKKLPESKKIHKIDKSLKDSRLNEKFTWN